MRARRGVHVGREKSWAVVEISPARHQSTADQRRCGDGELQRSEADVDDFNQIRAALTDSRVEYGSAVRSIHRLQRHARRIHQHEFIRNVQAGFGDDRNFLRAGWHCETASRRLTRRNAAGLITGCAGTSCRMRAGCGVL